MTLEELISVNVELTGHSYPIFIGSDFLADLGTLIEPYTRSKKIFVITDDLVEMLYMPLIMQGLEKAGFEAYVLTVQQGEASKSLKEAEKILEKILKIGCDRKTAVLSVGGGVVGDLAGFCASVLLRGVDFIQVPTTLLAQTDSSVGGKTAVNASSGKNLIGTFHQPKAVFIDTHTLKTLDSQQVMAGFGEVVKYGVILNADFWNWLVLNGEKVTALDDESCRYAIEQCCRIKAAVVAADEFEETGVRALLNYGHTIGHAIEGVAGMRGSILHGEAVAIGSVLAAWLSANMQLCDEELPVKISAQYEKWGLPVQFDASLKNSDLVAFMRKDKKVVDNKLNFVLLEAIGKGVLVEDVPLESVERVLSDKGRKRYGYSFY